MKYAETCRNTHTSHTASRNQTGDGRSYCWFHEYLARLVEVESEVSMLTHNCKHFPGVYVSLPSEHCVVPTCGRQRAKRWHAVAQISHEFLCF